MPGHSWLRLLQLRGEETSREQGEEQVQGYRGGLGCWLLLHRLLRVGEEEFCSLLPLVSLWSCLSDMTTMGRDLRNRNLLASFPPSYR